MRIQDYFNSVVERNINRGEYEARNAIRVAVISDPQTLIRQILRAAFDEVFGAGVEEETLTDTVNSEVLSALHAWLKGHAIESHISAAERGTVAVYPVLLSEFGAYVLTEGEHWKTKKFRKLLWRLEREARKRK